jgi:hypothetical protein
VRGENHENRRGTKAIELRNVPHPLCGMLARGL